MAPSLLSLLPLLVTLVACGSKGTDDTGGGDADGDAGTDGGSADGGSADGGSTDGGSTDGGSTDGGSTDGGSTDGGSGDGGSGPLDADGDGYDETVDCDDDDPTAHPDGVEVCDGVDNDCDGGVDFDRVPTDHATLQDAVDTVPDGAEICLEPGTYTETLDLSGRTLRFVGQAGADATILDLAGNGPHWTVRADADAGVAADIALRGVTITGELAATDEHVDIEGGFAWVQDSSLRLEGVRVSGLSGRMADGGSLNGLLVYAISGDVTLEDVAIEDVALTMGGAMGDDQLGGGVVQLVGGSLHVDDVEVRNFSITSEASRARCAFSAGFLDVYDIATVDIQDLRFVDPTIQLSCSEWSRASSSLVGLGEVMGQVTDLSVSGLVVDLRSDGQAMHSSLIRADGTKDGLLLSGLSIVDGLVLTDSPSFSTNTAGLGGYAIEVEHFTFQGNTAIASGDDSGSVGNLGAVALDLEDSDAAFVDVRGNEATADARGAEWVSLQAQGRGVALHNFVVAGNRLSFGSFYDGPVRVFASGADIDVAQGDIVANQLVGTPGDLIGGIHLDASSGGFVDMRNVQVVDNTLDGKGELYGVLSWVEPGVDVAVSNSNLVGHAAGQASWGGTLSGSDGNISADPLYVDISSTDPTAWDLNLSSGSPAIDAGDSKRTDDDGTTSDMGAYGGAGGSAW